MPKVRGKIKAIDGLLLVLAKDRSRPLDRKFSLDATGLSFIETHIFQIYEQSLVGRKFWKNGTDPILRSLGLPM